MSACGLPVRVCDFVAEGGQRLVVAHWPRPKTMVENVENMPPLP